MADVFKKARQSYSKGLWLFHTWQMARAAHQLKLRPWDQIHGFPHQIGRR